MYSFILTTFNDADNAILSYKSLLNTIPANTHYKIVVVDAGSAPEEIEKLESEIGSVIKDQTDLSTALNSGIYKSLGYDHENIDEFVKTGNSACDYVFWIHPDMMYHQYDWAGKLISIYEACDGLVARLGPGTSCIDNSIQQLKDGIVIGHSNQCPWVISKDYIRKEVNKNGFVYDPDFIKVGGGEDHSCWFSILEDGQFVCVSYLVDVVHIGGGNRFQRDTQQEQIYNREVFERKWHHNIFPEIDFPLMDINKDLMDKFGYLKDEVIGLIPKRDEMFRELKNRYKGAIQ